MSDIMQEYEAYTTMRKLSEAKILESLYSKFPKNSKGSWVTSRSQSDGTIKDYRHYGIIHGLRMDSGWARVVVTNTKTGKGSILCFDKNIRSEEDK